MIGARSVDGIARKNKKKIEREKENEKLSDEIPLTKDEINLNFRFSRRSSKCPISI